MTDGARRQPDRVVIVGGTLPPPADPIEVTTVVETSSFKRNVMPPGNEPAPSGTDGFFVGDKSYAALRIRLGGGGGSPAYDLEIYTRDSAGGSQFIQAVCETRSGLSTDYTRIFNVTPITENIAVRIVNTNRQLFIEWSAG